MTPAEETLKKREKFSKFQGIAGWSSTVGVVLFTLSTANLFGEWVEPRHILFVACLILCGASASAWFVFWNKVGDAAREYDYLRNEEVRKQQRPLW